MDTADKQRAAVVSLLTNGGLSALKLVAATITGSVALLSEAFHSVTDVIASAVTLASVKVAAVPPDDDHPYGHAKIENIASFAEAILLGGLALYVLVEALQHLLFSSAVRQPEIGIFATSLSAVASLSAGHYVAKVGQSTASPALRSNGAHLMTDFWSSGAVLLALVIVRQTGLNWVDGVVGIILGLWLLTVGWRVGYEAVQQLIDRRLSDEDIQIIRDGIQQQSGILSFHRLRTRLSGNLRYIDFHVVVPPQWTVVQAHEMVDAVERRLRERLAPAVVIIHVDPYDEGKAKRDLDKNSIS